MATKRQVEAIENLVENRGNKYQAMIRAGYSHNTAKNPQNLTKSRAFQDIMDEYLPTEMLLCALSDDICTKIGNRKSEIELALKLRGLIMRQEKEEVKEIFISDERKRQINKALLM